MINKITYVESRQYNPYRNLAVEEYLLLHCEDTECILYLWQNENTIVIGRNQNAWKECLVSRLQEDGGHLARRLSGGGAVYHDLGNLNFTFLVRGDNYSVEKQQDVILKAVQKLGVSAKKSGRNDIMVDGKKFSGNAFYEQGSYCYHHGTLMVNVNLAELSKYLTVSKEKLQSKGVDSVKSRVGNLTDYVPDLTTCGLKRVLRDAFEEVYGLTSRTVEISELPQDEIAASEKHFSSWDWLYGRKMDFQYELSKRFSWGQVTLQFKIADGRVADVEIYSDALKLEALEALPQYLKNIRYNKNSICTELKLFWSEDEQESVIMKDIIGWFRDMDF